MFKLTIELVPKSQWGFNLRSDMSKQVWDKLRKDVYKAANYCCEICGGKGPKWPVECHERWQYDDVNKLQILKGLTALCPDCHRVKHMGRAIACGEGPAAIAHFITVNNCTEDEAEEYMRDVQQIWGKRSCDQWELDLSWLADV